jgi:hypothetical protein
MPVIYIKTHIYIYIYTYIYIYIHILYISVSISRITCQIFIGAKRKKKKYVQQKLWGKMIDKFYVQYTLPPSLTIF